MILAAALPPGRRRRLAGAVLAAAALLLGAAAPAAAAEGPLFAPEQLRGPGPMSPHYGDALYGFLRERHFSALTGLMVAQHFGRVPAQAAEAELLRGALLLSWGMHREATQVFTRLGEQGAAPALRDRAWFHLAKIRYQRGLLAEAREALGRVGPGLPPGLRDERLLLEANVLMAGDDYAGAARLLGTADSRPELRPAGIAAAYLRYNLGIALLRSGAAERGSALLDQLGSAPAVDEESRSLRDKANVALGYAALQAGKPEFALVHLQRVRLHGLHANQALLGFGWAAVSEQLYKQALVPWLELSGRDASDAAVLEARIAVPHAYAAMGAHAQSLARYREAIATFEREGARLDESIAAFRAGTLLEALIERNPGEETGWFWRIEELPQMPHAGHLSQVFARHEFQEAFKNYRDLRFLERRLRDWSGDLGVFGEVLDQRRRAHAAPLAKRQAEAAAAELAAQRQRRDALAAELGGAETQADGHAFADARQRELLARLDGVRSLLRRAGADPALAAAGERARLAAGVLAWELARQHPARAAEARKGLQAADAGLAEAARRDAALARAQREEPARLERFAGRSAELAGRIEALAPRLAALGREQQEQVQELAVAELRRQQERLAVYAAQARFAVAQLYDRAAPQSEADRAGAR